MYRFYLLFFVLSLLISCGSLKQDFEGVLEKSNDLSEVDLAPNLPVRALSADTKTWNDVVTNSPEILAAEIAILDAQREAEIVATAKGLQVNSTIQAGSMSLVDEKNGMLGSLNIDKLVTDFGQTDARTLQANVNIEIAKLNYLSVVEKQLLTAGLALNAWESGYEVINLTFSKQVLAEPLIENLRRLAVAGQIDAIQLAAAEQQFAQLELTKVRSMEAVKKAEIIINKFFNKTPDQLKIDLQELENFTSKLSKTKPIQSVTYRIAQQRKAAADMTLLVHKTSDKGSIVARSKLDVPAADNMETDATVGIVYSKILRDGGRHEKITNQLEAKIRLAEADMLSAMVEVKSKDADLRAVKTIVKSSNALRTDLINNLQDQISQLEDQLAIGTTSFNELLSSHIELYQLQREEIESFSELRRINLELIAVSGRLPEFMNVRLFKDLEN
jgi:hypothetical protein